MSGVNGPAWAKSLPDSKSEPSYVEPEDELAIALASSRMLHKMESALKRVGFSDVLDVFTGNAHLPSALFIAVFPTFHHSKRHPSDEELDRAARMIVAKEWHDVTQVVFRRYGMIDNLRGFFRICADHLNLWDRIRHGIIQPTTRELYDFLVKVACDLYPSGPMDREVWVRAGGNASQLELSGTGHSQWSSAVRILRSGNQVRIASLIAAMREDFPLNDQLDYLARELQ